MTTNPPTWVLCFDDFDTNYQRMVDDCASELEALSDLAHASKPLTTASLDAWVELLVACEALTARVRHLSAYVNCRRSEDTNDAQAQQQGAKISKLRAKWTSINAKIIAGIGQSNSEDFQALIDHPKMTTTTGHLTRLRDQSATQMSPQLEALSADLGVNGIEAWGRLYSDLTSAMTFVGADGKPVPLAWRRGMLQDPDPQIRRTTLENSNAALCAHGRTFTAAINAISGTRISLAKRRGDTTVLHNACIDARLSKKTLDAMLGAVKQRREIPQRYLKHKAKILGLEQLGFSDISAPLNLTPASTVSWPDAVDLVKRAFSGFHNDLTDFAQSMLDNKRVEAEPRAGKRPGAYCTSSHVDKTSRVFMTYRGRLSEVRTLAHELGHAYHNHVMSDLRSWARSYPATLAESASIFCECLLSDAMLAQPGLSPAAQAAILGSRLDSAVTYMLNIPMRFEFESAVYQQRREDEWTTDGLCRLMHDTQLSVYSNAINPAQTDEWFWASKLHFFLTYISFYNFPYTFGYLFSLGLRSIAQTQGATTFHPTWVNLLRQTGQGTVEDIAHDALGIDLTEPDFWHRAIDGIEKDLSEFETALGQIK